MPVTALTADERETTVLSTDGDDLVRINTAQRRFITRLRRNKAFTEVASGFYGSTEWAEFTIPAGDWNPASGAKRSRQPLTEAQREAASARLREIRLTQSQADRNGSPLVGSGTPERA